MQYKCPLIVLVAVVATTTGSYNTPPRPVCPTPVPRCLVFPCQQNIARCRCFPKATCVPTCFCSAEFFIGRKKVDCESCPHDPSPKCPPGVPVVNCFDNPCRTATCRCDPTATCRANFCGGCNADFLKNGKKVNCNDCIDLPGEECPPGVPQALCQFLPCDIKTCPRFRNAICKNNFCGGCSARFFIPVRYGSMKIFKEVTEQCSHRKKCLYC